MKENKTLQFLTNAIWLQDLAVNIASRIHPSISHGLSKVSALQKAFFYVELEKLEGDYLEFGVFQGSSFISAYKCWTSIGRGQELPRSFYGFDSFSGVRDHGGKDQHPSWVNGTFAVDFLKVNKRISKHLRKAKWELVRGYVEDTIQGKQARDFGIDKVAIALIDVDLGGPAKIALDFLRASLQKGSIVIFDDYLFYRGSSDCGEQGAFNEFQRENDNVRFTRLFDYGVCGRAFIVSEISKRDEDSSKFA
jgi:O-methyltransferase